MESYLYTNEGIAAAFDRLEENGSLLFFLSAGQDFARRIAAGFDPASHAVAYEGHAEGIISFRYQLVVASRSERAVAEWREYLEAGGLRIERFRLDGPGAEEPRAASDDSPFVYRPIPFVVPVLSSSIALLALALVALVLRSPSRREAAYFGLVGVAFVFSEMNALVASRAALGGYYTTSAMVFALIALGYAGGALLSARLGRPAIAGITVFAFGLAALSSLCSAGVSGGVEAVVVLVAKTLPLGVAMGCYLPRGLARALAHRVPSMVAADILGGAIGTLAYYLVVFRLGTQVAWLGGAGLYLSALALL
jgi:hypothetical protein